MSRYFIELAYKGTSFSGFQSQKNANTIQAEVEKAFRVIHKDEVSLVGSSRTDAGVHAMQNFFHFDFNEGIHPQFIYKMNAILPGDIVIRRLIPVPADAHCRFDAISREYNYHIYRFKDPFLRDRAYYFPYKLDMNKLEQAAQLVMEFDDFTTFSKRKTQVKSFVCKVFQSEWVQSEKQMQYRVKANRFLRGMVKGLVATMLLVGRNKISLDEFVAIIQSKDCEEANFTAPSHGLFLTRVNYPDNYFEGVGPVNVKM